MKNRMYSLVFFSCVVATSIFMNAHIAKHY